MVDDAAVERAARAIAANKRDMPADDPRIDEVWHSYVGQARAALKASGLEFEVEELKLAAKWLAQVSNGCEEITCADEYGENCLCFSRLVGMVRAAGGSLRDSERIKSRGETPIQEDAGTAQKAPATDNEQP